MSAAMNIVQFPGQINPAGSTECLSVTKSKGAQLEDGYMRIANELVEALAKAPLTSREARIMRAVERATYGWGVKAKRLAASVLSKITDMTEQNASKALNSLIRKKVLIRDGGSRSPVRINTNVSEWDFSKQKSRVSPKQEAEPEQAESAQSGLSESAQSGLTNKDIDKNNMDLSKDKSCVENPDPENPPPEETKSRPDAAVQTPNGKKWGAQADLDNARHMADTVARLQGAEKSALTDSELVNWADECRRLRGMKTNSGKQIQAEHIRKLWDFAHLDEFWQRNMLSPKSLRKHWERLAVQYQQQRNPAKPAQQQNSNGRPAYITDFSDMDYKGSEIIPDWAKED